MSLLSSEVYDPNNMALRFALGVFAAFVLGMAGCSAGTSRHTDSKSPRSSDKESATITADPNPIQVCDGTGAGITKLTWAVGSTTLVEAHVNSPNGNLLARTGGNGTKTTGKWVIDGMSFYLQDVSRGDSLTSDHTLATVTVKVTSDGCSQ
jgi:hypothetical protein